MNEKTPLLGNQNDANFRALLASNDFLTYDHQTQLLYAWEKLSPNEQATILIEQQSNKTKNALIETLCGHAHNQTLQTLFSMSTDEIIQKIPEKNLYGLREVDVNRFEPTQETGQHADLIKAELMQHTANYLSKNKISDTDHNIKQALSVFLLAVFITTCVVFPPAGPAAIIGYAAAACFLTKLTELGTNFIQSRKHADNPLRAQAYKERCTDNIKEMFFMTVGCTAAALGMLAAPVLGPVFAALIVSSVLGTAMKFGASRLQQSLLKDPEKNRPIVQGIHKAMMTIGTLMENPFHFLGLIMEKTGMSKAFQVMKKTFVGETNVTQESRRVLIDELSGPLRPLVSLRNYAGESIEYQRMSALQETLSNSHAKWMKKDTAMISLNPLRTQINNLVVAKKEDIVVAEREKLENKLKCWKPPESSLGDMETAMTNRSSEEDQHHSASINTLDKMEHRISEERTSTLEERESTKEQKQGFIGPPRPSSDNLHRPER